MLLSRAGEGGGGHIVSAAVSTAANQRKDAAIALGTRLFCQRGGKDAAAALQTNNDANNNSNSADWMLLSCQKMELMQTAKEQKQMGCGWKGGG